MEKENLTDTINLARTLDTNKKYTIKKNILIEGPNIKKPLSSQEIKISCHEQSI